MRFSLGETIALLQSRFAALACAACRQKFVDLSRGLLNDFTLRQFIALERILGDRPQITALLAEGVFEQQRVGIELRLNLFELERLRLS